MKSIFLFIGCIVLLQLNGQSQTDSARLKESAEKYIKRNEEILARFDLALQVINLLESSKDGFKTTKGEEQKNSGFYNWMMNNGSFKRHNTLVCLIGAELCEFHESEGKLKFVAYFSNNKSNQKPLFDSIFYKIKEALGDNFTWKEDEILIIENWEDKLIRFTHEKGTYPDVQLYYLPTPKTDPGRGKVRVIIEQTN